MNVPWDAPQGCRKYLEKHKDLPALGFRAFRALRASEAVRALNPKPQTLDPKPQTLNPKP